MNHQPFELWLLEEQRLSPAQQRELEAHLRTCAHCTALVESGMQLRAARGAAPAAGFTRRFALRLATHRAAERRKRFWGMAIFSIGGVAVLGWLGSPIWMGLINSPAEWIARILGYIFFLATSAQALTDVGWVLIRMVPGFVPPFAWMVLASGLAGIGLLWIISIWRLTHVPRGVS